jgi:hypothetical protein
MARFSLCVFTGIWRTKGIDLAGLIVYNLSNWTGLRERAMPQGLPSV